MNKSFEIQRTVILSQAWCISSEDRCCDISGEDIYAGENHYSIGIIDRLTETKSRLHVTAEIGNYFHGSIRDCPLWFRNWFFDNRISEDCYE